MPHKLLALVRRRGFMPAALALSLIFAAIGAGIPNLPLALGSVISIALIMALHGAEQRRELLSYLKTAQRADHQSFERLRGIEQQVGSRRHEPAPATVSSSHEVADPLLADVSAAITLGRGPSDVLVVTGDDSFDLRATGAQVVTWQEVHSVPHLAHPVVLLDLGKEPIDPRGLAWVARALRWPHGSRICVRADDGYRSTFLSDCLGAPLGRARDAGRLEGVVGPSSPPPTWGRHA
jgi:hypothetical protein